MGLKIIHIISSLARGGRERQLSIIFKYTDKDKYSTRIIYFNESDQNYIVEYHLSKDLIRINESGFLTRLFHLLKILRQEQPDLIFSWGINESVLGLLSSMLTGVRFVNGSIRHGIRLNRSSHLFRYLILKISPNVVANSKAGLLANGIRKGYVLYNGVDKIFAKKDTTAGTEELKVRLTGKHIDYPIIISVANLVPYKDYFSVLTALKEAKESGKDFLYIIIGDGPMKDEIIEMINAYGLSNYVLLTGIKENVNEYLQIADIFLHSSRGEGCSNAILEAMFSGLPVIASDTGGTSEIVKETFGFLFPYRDHNSLSGKIIALLDNPGLRETMAKKAFEYANDNFLPEKMIENYYKIITKIITNQ